MYGLALIGCLTFYGAYQEWFSWILLLTLVLFPWLSLLLSLGTIVRMKLEPSAASKIPVGTIACGRLKVYSNGPQPPLKSKISITRPITGEKWILNPGDKLPTDHCGGLVAELYKPKVFDYLGLFQFRIRKTNSRTFLVWPQMKCMEIPPDLSQHLARSWHPKPGGGYAENYEIRQYHPGDHLNQIHWKLSAKVGDLILREPMEPESGRMLLTMDLCGSPQALDSKFGRLIWLSNWLLDHMIPFEIRVLTGNGIECWVISDEWSLQKCVEALLCTPFVKEGSIQNRSFTAVWQHHIGGEPDET